MLKLRQREATLWLDVVPGVRVEVPALTIATLRAAESAGQRAMVDYMEAQGVQKTSELPSDGQAHLEGAFAEARLAYLAGKIQAWEGVGDETGPVDPTPQYIALFVGEPQVATAFLAAYDASARPELGEKKDYLKDGDGGRPAARSTARGAKAPAESAPA